MRIPSSMLCTSLLILGTGAAQITPDAGELLFKISGTVVDRDSGRPLDGATVAVLAVAAVAARDNAKLMRTGQDGRFSFESLQPGKYSLTAQRRGYLGQAFEQHDEYSTAIAVGPKLKSEDLVFRLQSEASISGTITDEANEPVRGASVMLFDLAVHNGRMPPVQFGLQQTNDEGAYRFSHVPAGQYMVAVSAQPWYAQNPPKYVNENRENRFESLENSQEINSASDFDVAYPTTFYQSTTDGNTATPIALSPGDNFVCDIGLQPVPAVHLVIPVLDTDQPRRWPNLMLRQDIFGGVSPNVHSLNHRGNNSLEITGLAPGHYTLAADVFDGNQSSHSSQEIDVSRDGRIETKAGSGPGEITGHINFESGSPVTSQIFVQLMNVKTQWGIGGAPVSANGDFKLEGVAPGLYEISFANAPGAAATKIVASGGNVIGHRLEIRDATPVQLQITVAQGRSSINGFAMRDKSPQAGVMVLLIPEDAANNRDLFRRDQSDSDGSFTLRSILPGKYTLVAIERGWELEWPNPAVLRPYLMKGTAIVIGANEKYKIDASVQPK